MGFRKNAAPGGRAKAPGLSLPERIKNTFSAFCKRFEDGSPGTKLSHLIFGAGNIYHGQYAKGL